AGATGVVLDAQLLLARESRLDAAARNRITALDGSETVCVGERLGAPFRVYTRPRWQAVEELLREEERLADSALDPARKREAWLQTVRQLAVAPSEQPLWFLGQDAALARPLAERFVTVGGILQALVERAGQQLATAARLRPLAEGSPLAARHGTRFPI